MLSRAEISEIEMSSSQPWVANRRHFLLHRPSNIGRGLDDEESGEDVHSSDSSVTEGANKDNSKHALPKLRDRYRNQRPFTGHHQYTKPRTITVNLAVSQPAIDQALAQGILKRLEEFRHLARAASTLGSPGFDQVANEVQHLQSWLLSGVVSQQKPERSCQNEVPDGASRSVPGSTSSEDDEKGTASKSSKDGRRLSTVLMKALAQRNVDYVFILSITTSTQVSSRLHLMSIEGRAHSIIDLKLDNIYWDSSTRL